MSKDKIKILFVDDDPERHDLSAIIFNSNGAVVWHARTIDEGIRSVTEGSFDIVCLDHDMEETHRSGVDVAEALAARVLLSSSGYKPFVWIHSWNIPGAQRISAALPGFQRAIRPFSEQACDSLWPVFVEASK